MLHSKEHPPSVIPKTKKKHSNLSNTQHKQKTQSQTHRGHHKHKTNPKKKPIISPNSKPKKINLLSPMSLKPPTPSNNQNLSSNNTTNKTMHKPIQTNPNAIKESIVEFYNFKKSVQSSKSNSSQKPSNLNSSKRSTTFNKHLSKAPQSKYEKYNAQNQLYQLSNDYSKIAFDNKNFIERMEHYSLKNNLKEIKLNELLQESKPKITEKQRLATFNRLIEDSNRRTEQKEKLDALNSGKTQMKGNTVFLSRCDSAPLSNKKWEKTYKKRFKDKYETIQKILELKREEQQKQKLKEEEEIIKLAKNTTRYKSKDNIKEINNRLYYKPQIKKLEQIANSFRKKQEEKIISSEEERYKGKHKSEYNFNGLTMSTEQKDPNENYKEHIKIIDNENNEIKECNDNNSTKQVNKNNNNNNKDDNNNESKQMHLDLDCFNNLGEYHSGVESLVNDFFSSNYPKNDYSFDLSSN